MSARGVGRTKRDAEHGRTMAARVRAEAAAAVPFIRELHALGMIDGWRNVERVNDAPPDTRIWAATHLRGDECVKKEST